MGELALYSTHSSNNNRTHRLRDPGEEAELDQQLAKKLGVLEFLNQVLDDSRNREVHGLVLEFYNPRPHERLGSYDTLRSYDDAPRLTVFETKVDVARELGISCEEAIGLLRDLEAEECLRLSHSGRGPYLDAGEIILTLTEKGRSAVGVLPDPNEAWIEKLDAIAEAIGDLQGIRPEEKESALKAVEELKRFVHSLPPESQVELFGRLPNTLGLGSG